MNGNGKHCRQSENRDQGKKPDRHHENETGPFGSALVPDREVDHEKNDECQSAESQLKNSFSHRHRSLPNVYKERPNGPESDPTR